MRVDVLAFAVIELSADTFALKANVLERLHRRIAAEYFAPDAVEIENIEAVFHKSMERKLAQAFALVFWADIERELRAAVDVVDGRETADPCEMIVGNDRIHLDRGIILRTRVPVRMVLVRQRLKLSTPLVNALVVSPLQHG